MKAWSEAKLVELDLNQTAGGSWDITEHDGVIVYTPDPTGVREQGLPSEQYKYVSGMNDEPR